MKKIKMTSLAFQARVLGGIFLLIGIPYFGYLLAITSGTKESIGIIAGVMIVSGMILQVASIPCAQA
ncbi:MAG: hypothetical protein WC319_10630 [Candidatus Paceibacterota bacterium]